jgi:hypothetical protein
MTMAVGFVCSDGVVIGADRQITGAGYTFPECKLDSAKWKNGYGIFAYSGEHDAYRNFLDHIYREFSPLIEISREDVAIALKRCITALQLTKKEEFLVLFGFMIEGGYQHLLLATKHRVMFVPECEVIGYADSPLARYLLGRFRDVPHMVTVQQARIYAVDFISQAKKYDGQYVGDGIDVYSVDRSGDRGEECVRILDAGQTPDWEENIRLAHYWTDVFFSEMTNNKGQMINLELFKERMQGFRTWIGGSPIPWSKPSNPEK